MAAEVSADLALISDEDVLRRMWADTEDFGRKKEIRARMYKLREQRLKDFYTTGDVVTEVTGRKHLSKTHADSISDQGFITMKTKEIRDSESPTRDFSQRAEQGNGYWNSRQEHAYATGNDDGAIVEMKSNVTEGQGLIKEGNTETQMAMAAHNLHESSSKTDDNMSAKSEHQSHASKVVTSSKTDSGDSTSTMIKSAQEQSSQIKSEQKSFKTSSSTTKLSSSSTSSSKRMVSSSSQNYQVTSDQGFQSLRDTDDRNIRAITSSDDSNTVNRRIVDSNKNFSETNDSNITDENYTTRVTNDSNTSRTISHNLQDNSQEFTSHIIKKNVDLSNDQYLRTNDVNIQNTQTTNEKRQVEQNERLYEIHDPEGRNVKETYSRSVIRDVQDNEQDTIDRYNKTTDTKKFITNEKFDTQDIKIKEDEYVNDNTEDTRIIRETQAQRSGVDDIRQTSRVERTSRTDIEANATVTDQKIMNEIHKLDTYLSSQNTPAHSTPISPHNVTDGANWTVVSSKDGEFIYHGEKPTPTQPVPSQPTPESVPKQPTASYPPSSQSPHPQPGASYPASPTSPTHISQAAPNQTMPIYRSTDDAVPTYQTPADASPKEPSHSVQPREKIIKHPSSLDLPKEATDGQYVTTYQQSYNRISVDNSPSHDFFASTLRASPDRSTPSPTKRIPSRGSLDRSSPERRVRATSKGSLDRSSPETKPRSTSKGSLDRSSPERKYRASPTKTPDRERRVSSGSFSIEKTKDSKRKSTDTSKTNSVKETTTKTKRKFTSTQTKAANKTRVSTPGASPSTSPTRKYRPKDTTTTTDSDSDVSHGTYKKITSATSEDKNISVRQEKITVTTKQDTVVTDQNNAPHRESSIPKNIPRDKSPEYSSEGSVSREIRENRIRDHPHEFSPDRSAFAPIKQIRTSIEEKDESINLITTERQFVSDEVDERVEVREEEDRPASSEPRKKKPVDDNPENRMPQRTVSTEQIITDTDSTVITRKDFKETDITNIESIRSPHSSTEKLKEKYPSPDGRDKEVKKGKPVTRTPSSSPSPERTTRRHQPSRTEKNITTQKETKTFITEERRRTIPERSTDTVRRTADSRRTSKEITEHPTKKYPRESSPGTKPEPTRQKSRPESPRKKPSSPAESPERCSPKRPSTSPQRSSVSPDRPSSKRQLQQPSPQKYKPDDSSRTLVKQIETDTQKITRRTVISETNKLSRKSSIPRAETKPISKSQTPKERPESINRPVSARKPQSYINTTPQKTRTPLSERTIVTVTKTSRVAERKPLSKTKDSPSQPSNGNVRKVPTSPLKKPVSPATTPKTSPTNRKENNLLQRRPKEPGTTPAKDIRHPSNQKENKRPTRPVSDIQGKKTTLHVKDTRSVNTRKSQEITEFIEHEKVKEISDLEDECPPEEFYADFDDNSQTTEHTRQTTTKITKTETTKSNVKDNTPSVSLKQIQKKPTAKPKQILKEPKSVNETTKIPYDDTQRTVTGEVLPTSDDEEEVTEVSEKLIISEHYATNRKDDKESIIKNSNQDLLTVIVQHPKSSRESSPGYPATGIPLCSTSEDGESNPRYADFISEPDTDADTYDKVKSPSEPVPFRLQTTVQVTDLDDEETEVRTSVAERVNEFLVAAKQTREPQEATKPEVQIDSAKSVLKAKAMFENIAKNQTAVNVTTKSINVYETQPETSPKPTLIAPKSSKPDRDIESVRKPEECPSQPFKQINDLPKSERPSDLEPSDDEDVPSRHAVMPKSVPKSYDTVDQQEQINYVEEIYEEQQIKETASKISKSEVPRESVKTPKELPSSREHPEKKETKKPLDRKPSGPTASISSKKDFFERKAQNLDKPKTPLKDTLRTKPQKVIPKVGRNFRPETNEPRDHLTTKGQMTEKTERTESYLKSTVASSVRSQTPEKQPKDRRDSKPEVIDKEPSKPDDHEQSLTKLIETEKTESYLRSTVASTVRSQTPEKQPKDRRDSKPDILDKVHPKPKEHERSPTRQVDSLRKTSKPEEPVRKTSRPDEVTRKTSKPEDYLRRTSKEEYPTGRQTKPKERSKSPLKPDERMKSPSKVIEATKVVQKTVELTKRPSKTETSSQRPIKPETEEIRSPVKGKDINTLFKHSEQTVQVHKEGKFGVTLRKTPSSTKVTTITTKTTPKKPSTTGDLPEIEDIFDLEVLEDLLLKAVGYDDRRRIRAQIRIVKKQLEEEYNTPGKSRTVTTTTTTTYTTTIPSVKDIKAQSPKFSKPDHSTTLYERTTKTTTDDITKRRGVNISPERRTERISPERHITRSPERHVTSSPEGHVTRSPETHMTRSPERKSPDRRVESRRNEIRTESVRTYRKESSPKRESPDRQFDRISPEKQTPRSIDRKSPERKPFGKQEPKTKQPTEKTTERKISADRKKSDAEGTVIDRTNRIQLPSRDSKSEMNYETTTTVKSQTFRQVTSTTDTKETCPTDSITSSYGVGPTDENGRPLFGLKALRRTNTNKTLGENELEEQITLEEDETEEVYDSNGRPLFGLKALQATTEEDTMPVQTAQLRELVEKHQQYARESSAKEIKPVQKPKAKLRDSFILTTDDDLSTTTTVTTTTSHQPDEATRGLSLRSIIKKHEQISNSGNRIESEMESRRTVVSSHSTVSSDGKITHKKNVIHGEISSKNGEAPVGKITQKTYTYQTPDDKQALPSIKSVTKTSTIGQRRSSGPKIEEVKNESSSNVDITRRYSNEYIVEDGDSIVNNNKTEVLRKSSDISEGSTTAKSFTSILKSSNKDEEWNTTGGTVIRRTSGPKLTEFPEDGVKSKVTRTTTTTTTRSVIPDSKEDGKRPLGRGDSVKALQHKFQQATVSSTLKQSNVERTDSKGRIQETKTREIITSNPVISTQVKTLEDSQTVKTSPTTVTTRISTVTKGPVQEVKTTKVTETITKSGATSFLDDNTKVTGVQDILTRMRNADLVSESSDTTEDAEARALLNKFLGASVILQGMEQGMKAVHSSTEAPSSAALVIQAEKQRVKDANIRTQEDDIDDICDEKQLRILLEACSDYEGRRKIRARLRTIMADHKGADEISECTTGLIANNTLGECSRLRLSSNNGIEDSGTESGEEVRLLKPEVIQEVQSALSRLEDVIPGLEPSKRDAVSQLVNSLQTCLKIPPPNPSPVPPPRRFGSKKSLRNRHTVGVTREELADARRWIDEHNLKRYSPQNLYGSSDSLATKVFRPVKFVPPVPVIEEKVTIPPYLTRMTVTRKQFQKPLLIRAGYFMEPGPQNGVLSYIRPESPYTKTDRIPSDTVQDSLFDYDPSLGLFTPEQSVQIAVHKAAINKQISREELRRRGSSEDGDVSSGDEENNNLTCSKELSSAQRLLQIATDDKSSETNKFNGKGTKKLKMKRSNTIDIPKPANFYDYSSDDYGASADEGLRKAYDDLPRNFGKEKKIVPPTFEPKTENDLKFLAFLKQVNDSSQQKVQTYNPCARGGKHWQNRFSTIKTAFEGAEDKPTPSLNSAKLFWQNNQNDLYNAKQAKPSQSVQPKLPWTVKTEENGVVVGSLTVSKPGHINNFKHAAISAFKPIEKKQTVVSPVSGSVKQIAAQKFSVTPTPEYPIKPEKNYKVPQTKTNNANFIKNDKKSSEIKSFPINSNATQKAFNSTYHAPVQDSKPRGIITNKFLNESLHQQKQEQPYQKDNQPVKVWSYQKFDSKKEPVISAHAQFKTLEPEISKEPKNVSNYARNIGRTFETAPSPINKKSIESGPSQNWSNNSNFAHFNNVTNREGQDRTKAQQNFSTGGIYNRLPFVNDHIPTVNNRYKSEMNGHDSHHQNVQKNNQIKPTINRNYFSDLNTRNSSLINATTPSFVSKEKQRFSLPENKLIEQYKDNTSKSNENIEKLRSLELRISQNEINKLSTPHLSNYSPYTNNRITEHERKATVVIPQALIIPDKSAEYKMTHNLIDYTNDSPSNSYLLSPEDNTSRDTPQNILNSPQLSTFTFSSDDRITPNEIIQKPSLSPQFNNYSPQNLSTFERISPAKLSPGSKLPSDNFISLSSYESQHSKSPSIKIDDSHSTTESPYLWVRDSLESVRKGSSNDHRSVGEHCIEEKAVTRVMGQAQCQQAVTINNRTKRRYDSPKNIETDLKLQIQQSARQKALSPSFPNVIQKSESWHQMVKEQMHQAKQAPPLPKITKAKSSHTLALPKQFEAAVTPETVSHKKMTVSQYLSKQSAHSSKKLKQSIQNTRAKVKNSENSLDDDLDNVDEVFETIFQESNKKRNSK